jgi:hypothetical protein
MTEFSQREAHLNSILTIVTQAHLAPNGVITLLLLQANLCCEIWDELLKASTSIAPYIYYSQYEQFHVERKKQIYTV